MHRSSYLRMEYLVKYYEANFAGDEEEIKVLDIGSYDMGGIYKEIFQDSRYNCIITASRSASSEIRKKLQNAGIECRTLYLENGK